MFERFILATDLSAASSAIVNCAGALRDLGGRHCLLLLCLDMQEVASIAFSYTTEPLKAILAQQQSVLEAVGFTVEARIVPGFAKHEINRVAEQEGFDLIVVGSHGHSIAAEALLGGVATEVIHSARKPVLVVRLKRVEGSGEICIQPVGCEFGGHILYPTDFSECADHAFGVVEKLIAGRSASLTLMHVQDRARIEPHLSSRIEEFDEIDRERLERMRERLLRQGPAEIDIILRYGSPFAEIVDVVRERGVQLVVMGSQGRGFAAELFLGSVSHRVVRSAPAPVLLIPVPRR